MRKDSTAYIFFFALAVCVVCSFTLALVSQSLKPRQEMNQILDVKKNILKAVRLQRPLPPKASAEEVFKIYKDKIDEKVIDDQGRVVAGMTPEAIKEQKGLYPLYIYKEGEKVLAYCFPIEGKGLWSTIYGYLALEPDAKTVRGVTFYKHGETPGLGGEIEKDWFQKNFHGKKIWDDRAGRLRPVAVIKGKVADKVSAQEAPFYVDGISGATMTSKGVTALVGRWVKVYEPFFKTIRKN